jgi:hypothetical protein
MECRRHLIYWTMEKNVFHFDDDRSFNSVKMLHLCWRTLEAKRLWRCRFLHHNIFLGVIRLLLVYYNLSYTDNYNIFRLVVYPACFDIYNVVFRGTCFYPHTKCYLKVIVFWTFQMHINFCAEPYYRKLHRTLQMWWYMV